MSKIRFDGRVAVVTGAGRSIGRAYAIEMARRGAAVVVNDIGGVQGGGVDGQPWADTIVDEIIAVGGRAVASYENVATWKGGESLIQSAVDAFGSVDIVVNNAGFLRPAMFGELTPEQVDDVIGVHLLGAFHVTQPAWRIMQKQGYGRILLTSSSASFGQQGNTPYAAAKEGLLALARSLSLEGRSAGIKVNALLPYAISDMVKENPIISPDLERTRAVWVKMESRRRPDTVTPLALLLASEDCPVSGNAYSILAGRYARTFLANTEGWVSRKVEGLTPELLRERLAEIDDVARFMVPGSILDEIEFTQEQIEALERS